MFDEIRSVIPRLRRFGMLLLNSQAKCDVAIQTCLKLILKDRDKHLCVDDIAVHLFRFFLNSVSVDKSTYPDPSGDAPGEVAVVVRYIPGITFVEMQAFLLRYVEEFDAARTARIMALTEREVGQLERQIERKVLTANPQCA